MCEYSPPGQGPGRGLLWYGDARIARQALVTSCKFIPPVPHNNHNNCPGRFGAACLENSTAASSFHMISEPGSAGPRRSNPQEEG